ncbi:hypothetical protein LCG56_27505 (plasmid) [Pseudomonas cannabina pv. alisalensis]|uniref:Uncharacterized protein n=1 Tax=Pseudomonas syringae pv. maculicola str. ES4326 TaxID=629265 RepID=A0A8T8CAC1_PSEYM|nr:MULTISPECIES: hypothetical protein [Pseudomonas syringae group]QHF00530.1 hypothetical protein PMA4326_028885 [Pseudomonas syringae pv. maculicola str. ES4326]UBZ00510.1 hypothetical protein LCG56_27505 [Pseudomonas cannabina pv. alisalensis]
MITDYTPLCSKGLATLPGVQAVDVVGGILVVLLINDSSIAVTSAALAEELGLEKWSALVGEEQVLSLTTAEMLDLIKRSASAASSN